MATTLSVTLSSELQQTLSSTTGGVVGVWALYFDSTGAAQATPLPVTSTGTSPATNITLPTPFNGGKIYFIVQSVDDAGDLLTFGAGNTISDEAQINWNEAATNNFRYDSFEVSLLGGAADAGNLTSVNSFGIPMSVSIGYPNNAPTQTRGYNIDGDTMFSDIGTAYGVTPSSTDPTQPIQEFTAGPLAGSTYLRAAAAPSTILTTVDASGVPLTGASASDFYAYVEALGNGLSGEIRVAGQFNGAASVDYVVGATDVAYPEWHNAAFYAYTMTFEQAATPVAVHTGASQLGPNPFSVQNGQAVIYVDDPNAGQYSADTGNPTLVSFSNVTTGVGSYTAAELSNQTFAVVNVISPTQYAFLPATPATQTASVSGGGSAVETALPIVANPLATVANEMQITVQDDNAALYANTGVEVTLSGATDVGGLTAAYLNGTTFTITGIVDATHYTMAPPSGSGVAASSTATGGGTDVAPTYARPNAGTFTFTPEANSQVQGAITISSLDLANSIYSTLGSAEVIGPQGPYPFTALATGNIGVATPDMNTGANSQWGALFVKLLSGLDAGYFGNTGNPLNALLGTAGPNLNLNWNFDPSYAFDNNVTTPFSWNTATYGAGVPYDKYAEIFFDNSNSYGNGYSDALMALYQQGGPLVATGYPVALGDNPFTTVASSDLVIVTDPNVANYAVGDLVTFAGGSTVNGINMAQDAPSIGGNFYAYTIQSIDTAAGTYTVQATATASGAGSGGGVGVVAGYDVPAIDITLFDDDETPTGYTPPVIYNTPVSTPVQPQSAGFSSNLAVQFALGVGQMRPSDDLTVKLGFYTGQSGSAATFDYVTFDTGGQSLFQTWTYDSNGGTLTPVANSAAASGTELQINGLPYVTGTNWYQLLFESADGSVQRAYNIYLDALAGSGIYNPAFSGNNPGAIAIDGLASYGGAATSGQFIGVSDGNPLPLSFAMFSGGTVSMDPQLLALITDPAVYATASNSALWPTPAAPVLGTMTGPSGTFANIGGSGVSATPYSTATVTTGALAFGWFGADQTWVMNDVQYVDQSAMPYNGILGGYTNKIGGLNLAHLTIDGPYAPTGAYAQADLDGKWVMSTVAGPQSSAFQFVDGTYTVTMEEFLAGDTGFTTQVSPTSSPLTFTVDLPTMSFENTGGAYLQLDEGGTGGGGNWLKLDATGSTLPNGTLLAYATDADGNLIGRNGLPTTTLEDAVLARLGAVAFDDGSAMFRGEQLVYLPVGQQLRFAIESGDGSIQQAPGLTTSGTSTVTASVTGTAGTFSFSATPDNAGSSDAQLGQSQNRTDQPWVYLSQGQTVQVDVAGSAANTNTVHFVQIDVDPNTGAMSVDGVAYGNTDAFRSAVAANWDPGYAFSGGQGQFGGSSDWTVATATGFHAPVLVTDGGDIFVIGTANVDGRDHIRTYGQNMFGFEDLRADQQADFDYNDMVVKLTTT